MKIIKIRKNFAFACHTSAFRRIPKIMKILRNTRRTFSDMGFLTDERIFTFKYGHSIATAFFIFILIFCEVTNITYVVHQLKIGDYTNCLYAGLQITAVLPTIVSFLTTIYRQGKIREVIGEFQKISDKCNHNHALVMSNFQNIIQFQLYNY